MRRTLIFALVLPALLPTGLGKGLETDYLVWEPMVSCDSLAQRPLVAVPAPAFRDDDGDGTPAVYDVAVRVGLGGVCIDSNASGAWLRPHAEAAMALEIAWMQAGLGGTLLDPDDSDVQVQGYKAPVGSVGADVFHAAACDALGGKLAVTAPSFHSATFQDEDRDGVPNIVVSAGTLATQWGGGRCRIFTGGSISELVVEIDPDDNDGNNIGLADWGISPYLFLADGSAYIGTANWPNWRMDIGKFNADAPGELFHRLQKPGLDGIYLEATEVWCQRGASDPGGLCAKTWPMLGEERVLDYAGVGFTPILQSMCGEIYDSTTRIISGVTPSEFNRDYRKTTAANVGTSVIAREIAPVDGDVWLGRDVRFSTCDIEPDEPTTFTYDLIWEVQP